MAKSRVLVALRWPDAVEAWLSEAFDTRPDLLDLPPEPEAVAAPEAACATPVCRPWQVRQAATSAAGTGKAFFISWQTLQDCEIFAPFLSPLARASAPRT